MIGWLICKLNKVVQVKQVLIILAGVLHMYSRCVVGSFASWAKRSRSHKYMSPWQASCI